MRNTVSQMGKWEMERMAKWMPSRSLDRGNTVYLSGMELIAEPPMMTISKAEEVGAPSCAMRHSVYRFQMFP